MKLSKQEQKDKFIELAILVKRSCESYAKIFAGNYSEESINDVILAEKEGDEVRDVLDHYFSVQKNTPYLALDRAKLLRRIDDLLDALAIAAKIVKNYNEALPPHFTEETKDFFPMVGKIGELVSEAIERVFDDFEKTNQLTIEIENLRDEFVGKGFGLEGKLFDMSSGENSWKEYHSSAEIIKKSVKVVQVAKGITEILSLMVYKYLA